MSAVSWPPPVNPNDQGRGPELMGVLWTLTSVAVVVVSSRLYVRKNINGLGWDDWLMLVALVIQLIDMSFITKAYAWGLGKHDHDLTFTQLVNALKWGWLWMIPGTFVAVLARVSSAILLIRLFGVRKLFKWYLICYTALQVIGGIVVLLVTFTGTYPVEALWDPTVKPSRMNPKVALDVAITVQAIFTFADFTYVLFPVIIIWQLKMSLSQRVGLILLMCTSLVTVAASILKAKTLQTASANLTEPQYNSSLAAIWSGVEQLLVINMASIPALRAMSKVEFRFFSRLVDSFTSRFGSSRYDSKKSFNVGNSSKPDYYEDIEQNAQKLTSITHERSLDNGSNPSIVNQSQVTELQSIRRTDQYNVSYDSRSLGQ